MKKFALANLLASTLLFTACYELDPPRQLPAPDLITPANPVDPETDQVFPETGYSKINNDGMILADQTQAWDDNGSEADGTQWSCVRDNYTGLYWEVKTNDDGLRDKNWGYTWYDSSPEAIENLVVFGDTGQGSTTGWEKDIQALTYASGSDNCFDDSRCDTEKYAEDVSETQLCGFDDWRLPTLDGGSEGTASTQELKLLLTCSPSDDCSDLQGPLIDTDYFPNTPETSYWSSTLTTSNKYVWYVDVTSAYVKGSYPWRQRAIRLVRASQSLEAQP